MPGIVCAEGKLRSPRFAAQKALPLAPLLQAHAAAGLPSLAELAHLPGLGPRFAGILAASSRFLHRDFLDRADEPTLCDALLRFYQAVASPPLHQSTLQRRAGFVRHALGYLLLGQDSAVRKLEACLTADGPYRVPGLGPAFWSALLQSLSPTRYPGWTAQTRRGLDRCGLGPAANAGVAAIYSALLDGHARIRLSRRDWSALHIDHFLSRVALMDSRDLPSNDRLAVCPVEAIRARLRETTPLRQRLRTRGEELARGQQELQAALAEGDGKRLGDALALADPVGAARCSLDWGRAAAPLTEWVGRLWHADQPQAVLEQLWSCGALASAGLWLGPAVLHLRDPQTFCPFNDPVRQGLAQLDDGIDASDPLIERYRLLNEAAVWLRQEYALHPLETPELLAALAEPRQDCQTHYDAPVTPERFGGFCADTFAFLKELERENRREWMEQQRQRYHYAVRRPLVELCEALSTRYIDPVLNRGHGWQLETRSQAGRALTRISRNVFGKAVPYTSTLWITFCPAGQDRANAQLFVRLSPQGLRYGLRLGRTAETARQRLRQGIDQLAEQLFTQLQGSGVLSICRFGPADEETSGRELTSADDLRTWAAGRTQEAFCRLDPTDELLRSEDLPGEIALVFDRLLPLFALCMADEPPRPVVESPLPVAAAVVSGYTADDFTRETFLGKDWLHRACELLALKKQLILQGVPGTGKTHVARCLARLLTAGRDESIRLVQFHPAYSYEEFVEGIRVRTVDIDGRHQVTYPVEDGLLCSFAAQAAQQADLPHVLLIDEINRGNLPRIFGELLYLLEYRGQAVELPCSRRQFRLPDNLYLIGTMNATDRSIAPVDQALRRRFSFLSMEPDATVLASWLRDQGVPVAFASRVLGLFDRLNNRLRSELGSHVQIGHSYFMVPGLDESRLRMIWRHHIDPLLDDLFAGQPGRAAALSALFETPTRRSGRGESATVSEPAGR